MNIHHHQQLCNSTHTAMGHSTVKQRLYPHLHTQTTFVHTHTCSLTHHTSQFSDPTYLHTAFMCTHTFPIHHLYIHTYTLPIHPYTHTQTHTHTHTLRLRWL